MRNGQTKPTISLFLFSTVSRLETIIFLDNLVENFWLLYSTKRWTKWYNRIIFSSLGLQKILIYLILLKFEMVPKFFICLNEIQEDYGSLTIFNAFSFLLLSKSNIEIREIHFWFVKENVHETFDVFSTEKRNYIFKRKPIADEGKNSWKIKTYKSSTN